MEIVGNEYRSHESFRVRMNLVTDDQIESFANYAEKHDLFEKFHDAVSKLIICKPSDPYQFLIDYFAKPKGKAIILFVPPCSGANTLVGFSFIID